MGEKPMRDRRRKGRVSDQNKSLWVHMGRLDRSAVTPEPEDLPA